MSDIKMSECFSLPVIAKSERDFLDEYECHIYDGAGEILIPSLPDDVDGKAIELAINNHDRLTEEVERLASRNKALVAAINEVQDLPMHRIDEASFILNQALETQNANTKTNS